ncbi:unnamed protein product [Adineta ricciae]|uniref:Uncharacterized protein n=2 Tax=Adineta ricciae TaxID=249248 RepID=A0A815P0F6_ADIRI|nr:unnamed protein product [Adineta ricciae]
MLSWIQIALLFFYFASANCLQCTKCDNTVLSFDRATDFPSKCEGQIVESVACQAVFHIDYLAKEIRLDLANGDALNRTFEINLLVKNKFAQPKMLFSNVTYKCKDANDCAKVFYRTTISTLISKQSVLTELQNELYDPTGTNVQQCADNHNQPKSCINAYGCHGYEIIENRRPDFKGECRNTSSQTIFQYLYYDITLVQGSSELPLDWNHLGYTCNKGNLCNTQEKIKQMIQIANNYYPWEFIDVNSGVNSFIPKYYFLLVFFLYLI